MASFWKNTWMGGAAAVILLGGGLGIVQKGFIQPRAEQAEFLKEGIRNLQKEIDGVLAEFPDLVRPEADLKRMENQLARLQYRLNAWEAEIPRADELNPLLEGEIRPEPEKFYWQSEVKEGSREEWGPYVRETFRINALASYEALVKYLTALEGRSSFIDLLSLKVAPNESDPRLLLTQIAARLVRSE